MTRINLVYPSALTRQHLIAEYRELPRIKNLHPRISYNIPNSYRMGSGHVLFFMDKGLWLIDRYDQLVCEMQNRGYHVSYPELDLSHWPESMMNDWEPSKEEIEISQVRINEKLGVLK